VLKPITYDTKDWFEAEGLDLAARRGSALDASAILDKPAGKYGWVRPKGEGFVFAKTGKPVRFFGIIIVAGANFPSHEQAEAMAELMAQMGVNMTRHHHADAPWATHNFFGKGASTRQLDAESMERFDYLVYQLQKRGIYQYYDMLVHRQPLAADGIKEPKSMINGFKMEGEFAPDAIALEKEFIRQFLGHKNPYTGKKYGADPSVAGLNRASWRTSMAQEFWRPWAIPSPPTTFPRRDPSPRTAPPAVTSFPKASQKKISIPTAPGGEIMR
jgi:hypothetical protein